jgi:hypothetical protein
MATATRKRVRIETAGGQAFNVPCNEEGKTFLRSMRKFINRPLWRYSARGRGPRRRPGDKYVSLSRQASIPQADSEWLAVYLGGNGRWANFNAVLDPRGPQPEALYSYAAEAVKIPSLSTEEKEMLQGILEDAEIDLTHSGSEKSATFYSIFQKLVDI